MGGAKVVHAVTREPLSNARVTIGKTSLGTKRGHCAVQLPAVRKLGTGRASEEFSDLQQHVALVARVSLEGFAQCASSRVVRVRDTTATAMLELRPTTVKARLVLTTTAQDSKKAFAAARLTLAPVVAGTGEPLQFADSEVVLTVQCGIAYAWRLAGDAQSSFPLVVDAENNNRVFRAQDWDSLALDQPLELEVRCRHKTGHYCSEEDKPVLRSSSTTVKTNLVVSVEDADTAAPLNEARVTLAGHQINERRGSLTLALPPSDACALRVSLAGYAQIAPFEIDTASSQTSLTVRARMRRARALLVAVDASRPGRPRLPISAVAQPIQVGSKQLAVDCEGCVLWAPGCAAWLAPKFDSVVVARGAQPQVSQFRMNLWCLRVVETVKG